MRKNNENEIGESGKIFAMTLVLMNILIVTIIGGMFWLVQIIIMQINQLNDLTHGFYLS